jgi:hypothetical protein
MAYSEIKPDYNKYTTLHSLITFLVPFNSSSKWDSTHCTLEGHDSCPWWVFDTENEW